MNLKDELKKGQAFIGVDNNKYYRKTKQNFIFFYRQKIIFKQKYKKYKIS